MLRHVRNLEEESLARQIYEEQKRNGWPGLHEESRIICEELNIEDCNTTRLSKSNFRKLITTACHRKNEIFLRATASEVKCRRIQNEDYGQKEYLSMKTIHESRSWYRTRFGLQPFAGNYSHDRRFAKTNWLCKCGTAQEEEGHIVSGNCQVYGDLKDKFGDLGEDSNLVSYFQAVLDRREDLEREDRGWQPNSATVAARSVAGDSDRLSRPGDNILSG